MSAPITRRGILSSITAVTAAAAAGGASPAGTAFGRLRAGFAGGGYISRGWSLAPAVEAALPLDRETPEALTRLTAALGTDPAVVLAQQTAELRAIAALALAYPPEVAAYRSFGAPMRRRMYVALLARESARLTPPAEPPPTPPASPGPGA